VRSVSTAPLRLVDAAQDFLRQWWR
jgi:hypothetical protein